MKRVQLLSIGTQGDLQPYLALATRLKQEGYAPRITAPALFRSQVEARGIDFMPLSWDPRSALALGDGGRDPGVRSAAGAELETLFSESYDASRDADIVLYSNLLAPGAHVCEKLGVPGFMVCFQPTRETGEFPHLMLASRASLRLGFANRLSYRIFRRIYLGSILETVNRCRKRILGLPEVADVAQLARLHQDRWPTLMAFSEALVPRPRDWPAGVHVTGFWNGEGGEPASLPPDLAGFLARGDAPVYFGFGSNFDARPQELVDMILASVSRLGLRAVLQGGWSGHARSDLGSDVLSIGPVPHGSFFHRMAAITHHAGAGTTAAALRSGRPGIVVPFRHDQFFWAARSSAAGAAVSPGSRRRLTADRLARALEHALNDPLIQRRCGELASRLAAEDGVGAAVRVMESYAG